MPVYNAERYLRPAVESILAQTFGDFEFLIVNDGSSDGSRKIVESYADPRIKLVDNPRNMGLAKTLNRGLSLAAGDLIARQDADDISYPDRLRRQVEFLDNHPEVALVGAQARMIDEVGRPNGLRFDRCCEYESIRWDLLFDNSFTHTSVMFRRAIVAGEMDGYDESFNYCQDYDLWSRVASRYRVMNIPAVLVDYRVHPFERMSDRLHGVNAGEARRVIRRNMSAVLGEQAVTDEEVDLIVGARFYFRKELLEPFLSLFGRIVSAYQAIYPAVAASRDFRRAVTRQYLRLAYRAWRVSLYLACRVFAGSLLRYPVLRVSLDYLGAAAVWKWHPAAGGQARVSAGLKILFLVTEDWYFWSHRLDFARAVRDAGMQVLVATRVENHGRRIEAEGFTLLPVGLRRGSRHPWRELASILELVRLYRRERPDLVHHVAMKPMLYGSIAARLARVPAVVNAFAGLGYAFTAGGKDTRIIGRMIGWMLRWALMLPNSVILFQNEEDRAGMIHRGIVRAGQSRIIRGAGVDTTLFAPSPLPDGEPVVILASRLLWDKGVGEFVEAARMLKEQGVMARCVLAGHIDEDNPARISESQLREWQGQGAIEWWGRRDDMPKVLASASVVVLPSYREGLPKVLLEAAACGRPIVATDVPGCREIVRNGENGLLVLPRDTKALAGAIATLAQDRAMRVRMGARGREIVMREFSSQQVAGETLAVYRELLGHGMNFAGNIDRHTVQGFGNEWSRFDQTVLPENELRDIFEQYFQIFPWHRLPARAVGFDLGCGSGRWAKCVAPRVGVLHCIDASEHALMVAKSGLAAFPNCEFHLASVGSLPLADNSMDFGYSLGVLHHVPDTAGGIRSCVKKLKPGAPLLLYLYYAFDNRPLWYRRLWRISNAVRTGLCHAPFWVKHAVTLIIAATVYFPLARLSLIAEAFGLNVDAFPLSAYRRRSFYTMRTDALDRFGTRLEQRFTRQEISRMMEQAGLTQIVFSDAVPFWCAVGYRQ